MNRFSRNNNNNNDEVLMNLVQSLVRIYSSTDSSLVVSQRMVEAIEKAGGIVLGTGQNRIGFTMDNHETVFKVAYREIGFTDNMIERFNWDLIANNAEVYKELGPFCPEVTPFGLEGDLYAFMLQMEFVDDLSTSKTYASPEEAATVALMENSVDAGKCIAAWTKYFHILDAHPTASALNFGNKNNRVAFRDFGYCIPRIDDFAEITNTINNTPVIYEYVNMFDGLTGTTAQKIVAVQSQMEAYAPYDETGKMLEGGYEEEAADFVQALMKVFVDTYLG